MAFPLLEQNNIDVLVTGVHLQCKLTCKCNDVCLKVSFPCHPSLEAPCCLWGHTEKTGASTAA